MSSRPGCLPPATGRVATLSCRLDVTVRRSSTPLGWTLRLCVNIGNTGSTVRRVFFSPPVPTGAAAAKLACLSPENVLGGYFDPTSGRYLVFAEPAAQPAM